MEDDAGAREALCLALEEQFDVLALDDGVGAVEVIAAERPAAVVLDLSLPRVDGVEVLRMLREAGMDVPVVVVTGVNVVELARATARLGAAAFLRKPWDAEVLVARVRAAILGAAETRQRAPRSGTSWGQVLVMGGELGWRASIGALLRPLAGVVTVPDAGDPAAIDAAGVSPACAIVSLDRQVLERSRVLARLRAEHPGCARLVSDWRGGGGAAAEPSRVDGDIRWTRPARVDEVYEEGALALAPERPGPTLSRLVRAILQLVARRFDQRLTLPVVAAGVGWSPSSVAHALPKALGATLNEYVTRVRVQAGLELLATTRASQDEIALRVGLSGGAHLSNVVLEVTGQRPSQHRRSSL